jgi:RimJ/RimL family protein N-acetyltransferase
VQDVHAHGLGPVTLTGQHVRLEPLRRDHLPALLEAAQEEELWTWLSYDLRARPEMERWLDEALAAERLGEELPFAVISTAGRVIGSTRYMDIQARHRGVEIGWSWYARDSWGSAVNPEAKYLLLRHAFETWGAIRVCLKTDVQNVHSQRAIRKLGARHEGTLRNHRIRRDGTYRDTMMFSILEQEWRSVRETLERRLAAFG